MTDLPHSSARGITLVELIVVIAVLAIAAGIATPNLTTLINNNRTASQSNELIALINLARSQAIRSNDTATLQLVPGGNSWEGIVRVTAPSADEDLQCPDIEGAIRCVGHSNVSLDSNALVISFDSRGYITREGGVWEPVTINLLHRGCSNPRQSRRIQILVTGQLVATTPGCA